MSGAAVVLSLARAVGVRLRVDEDGQLKVAGKPEMVPPEILTGLRAHKAELIELLRAGGLGQAANDDGSPPEADQAGHGSASPPDLVDPPRNGPPRPVGDARERGPTLPCPGGPPGLAARPGGIQGPLAAPPDPATAPIGRCSRCGWIAPLNARRACWACSAGELPATIPAADHPPWTDDRTWLDLWRKAGPLAEREPVLRAWLTAAPPQPLPRRLAAIELARIACEHGIAIEAEASNAAPSSPDAPSRGTAVLEDERLSLTRQDVGSIKRD